MWKVLTVFWLPISIGITALAVGNMMEAAHPDDIPWVPLFAKLLTQYRGMMSGFNEPANALFQQYAGFGMPGWIPDALLAYVASATGFSMAGANLTTREGSLYSFRSSAASMGWPLAMLTFAANSVRNGTIRRFAAEHTALFVLYLAGVAALLAAAVWGPEIFGRLSA